MFAGTLRWMPIYPWTDGRLAGMAFSCCPVTVGILLVGLGVYSISLERLTLGALAQPLRNLPSDAATRYAFLTQIAVTGYSIMIFIGVYLIARVG